MTDDSKYYEGRKFRKLQKEWYAKAAGTGFYDIEGGVEGHLLKGKSGSVSLRSLANKSQADHGLKGDKAPREFADVADSTNADLLFQGGSKARYYHYAQLISAQAFREGLLPDTVCYVWQMHAEGIGERTIATDLELPRSRIRKDLAQLRKNIKLRIDNEHR